MSGYFSEIYTGGKSLLIGLGVTFKALIKPVVTVQYPREKIDVTPNIRGHIEFIRFDELDSKHNCLVFLLDFTKCILCGLCVESCSRSALRFSNDYELAGFSRNEFYFDLIKRLEEKQ
jgi:NADH-quinone oxidoreductase subunit I